MPRPSLLWPFYPFWPFWPLWPLGLRYNVLMEKFIASLPWSLLVLACLTLGLAPYKPPHIVEKLGMLLSGRLVRPIDWIDLIMHGIPWALIVIKGMYYLKGR